MRDFRLTTLLLPLLAWGIHCVAQQNPTNKTDEEILECSILYAGPADQFDCGLDKLNNSYVFVGTISAVHAAPGKEKYVEVIPNEVFLGDPGHSITAIASQGSCFEHLEPGQQWLFYLRNIDGKVFLDYNMQESAPVSEVGPHLETLRRMKNLVGTGLLRGRVVRELFASASDDDDQNKKEDANAIRGAHITVVRKSDQATFSTASGKDGSYEFPPLPVGDYEVDVAPIGSFHPVGMFADVKDGECRELILSNSSEARISGKVHWPDGKPAVKAGVLLIEADGSAVNSETTDEEGGFKFSEWKPGSYVVGARRPGAPKLKTGGCGGAGCADDLPADLNYFGNTVFRNAALVIKLGVDEKRDDVEIVLPATEPKIKQ
jgi:Carboxypeptidase regulatory-like domain